MDWSKSNDMSTAGNWRGPNIVKDGLVLYLDAGSPNSYYSLSTTTIWKDISGNANNGTLTNGPTFNPSNGGSVVFDGVDDYVSINTPSSINLNNNITIDLWINFVSFVQSNPRIIEIQDSAYSVQILRDGGNSKLSTKHSKWETGINNTAWSTPVNNTWYNIICIFQPSTNNTTLYQNGINLSSTSASNVGIGNQSNKIILGVRSDFNSTTWLNAYLPNIKIYNRALTSTEILQNFNATRSRFGV